MLSRTAYQWLFCVLSLASVNVARGSDITEYESDLIAQRQAITQIVVELESESRIEKSRTVVRSKRRIWQDGQQRRCDEIREVFDLNMTQLEAPYRRVAIETRNGIVEWNGQVQPDDTYLTAHWEQTTREALRVLDPFLPFDARWLGVTPSAPAQMRGKPFDAIVGAQNRTAAAKVTVNGKEILLDYTRPGGATVSQRYGHCGDQVILEHFTLVSPPNRQVTMDCRYPKAPEHAVAYPESVELKQFTSESIEIHDRSTIRVESINAAIPASIFTIEGIGLPIGTVVIGSAIPPELRKEFHHVEWDGRKLVLVSNKAIPSGGNPSDIRMSGSPISSVGRRQSEYVWLIAGSIFLLISAVAFAVYRRRAAVA